MTEASVTVIVPSSGRQPELLSRAVSSVRAQTMGPRQLVIIHPGAALPLVIRSAADPLPLRHQPATQDKSLTAGINTAIQRSRTEYVLLMNDDVRLDSGCLAFLIKCIDKHPQAGMVCGKLLRPGGRIIDSAGQMLAVSCRPVERGYGKPDRGQYQKPVKVFGCCGALVLYRKTMLEDAALAPGEYFDRTYHMFYEDVDISWRSRLLGWQAWYTPEAVAFHVRGATARQEAARGIGARYAVASLPPYLQRCCLRNRWLTLIKNLPLAELWWRCVPVIAHDLMQIGYYLLRQPKTFVKLRGEREIFINSFARRKSIWKKVYARKSV